MVFLLCFNYSGQAYVLLSLLVWHPADSQDLEQQETFLLLFLFFPLTYLLQYSKHTAKAKKIPLLPQHTAKKILRLHWKWLGIIPEQAKIYQDTAEVFQLLFILPTYD